MYGVYLAQDFGLEEGAVIDALRTTGLSSEELHAILKAAAGGGSASLGAN